MKHKTSLPRLCVFLFSVFIHIFALTFSKTINASKQNLAGITEPHIMRLVNLSEYSEAEPEPKMRQNKPEERVLREDKTAEHILEEPEADAQTGAGGAEGNPQNNESPDADGRLLSMYIKNRYIYIQRRIQSALVYPPQAKHSGIQGTPEIKFSINEKGAVDAIYVMRSSGFELLDDAAIKAIQKASPFRPPPPARITLVIPVAFSLR